MSTTKVTLRKREYPSGKIALYLDFYPAIRNPRTLAMSRREYLGIYLMKNPRTPQDRAANAKKLQNAQAIRAERELSLINEQYGFIDKAKTKMDALKYFEELVRDGHEAWMPSFQHFKFFCRGVCTFGDLTIDFCNSFKDYLTTAKKLNGDNTALHPNTAALHWTKFKAMLNVAYKEKYLNEEITRNLDKLETKETRREYLTIEEVNLIAKSKCKFPVLKSASLFSCLTGLRISDILQLHWEDILDYPDGGKCIRICTEKTEEEATLPISDDAYSLCGEPGTGIVFKGLTRTMTKEPLKAWLKACGIKKHITFHCFRHTYATLLVAGGTDIYTVSKMLTHKNVSTTQIYADLVSEKKRAAAEVIKIDK